MLDNRANLANLRTEEYGIYGLQTDCQTVVYVYECMTVCLIY